MSKHGYKIGDKVRVIGNSEPSDRFSIGDEVTVTDLVGCFNDTYGDIELADDDCTQWLSLSDIEPIAPTNTLTPGQTYTLASGRKMRVIHIEDGKAFGVFLHEDGKASLDSAYTWDMDGEYQNAVTAERAPYQIVFEPVREDTSVRLYYSTMEGFKIAADYEISDIRLSILLIDGVFDVTQAKVEATR